MSHMVRIIKQAEKWCQQCYDSNDFMPCHCNLMFASFNPIYYKTIRIFESIGPPIIPSGAHWDKITWSLLRQKSFDFSCLGVEWSWSITLWRSWNWTFDRILVKIDHRPIRDVQGLQKKLLLRILIFYVPTMCWQDFIDYEPIRNKGTLMLPRMALMRFIRILEITLLLKLNKRIA